MRNVKALTRFGQANCLPALLKTVGKGRRWSVFVGALWLFASNSFNLDVALAQQDAKPDGPPISSGPSPTRAATSITATWKQSLVAHVAKQKRYPAEAAGRQGVVSVSFTLDRQGGVANSRIAKSSGSSVLDAEALDMIRRAAPFPTPPAEITDNELSFVIPIQFAARQ